ncbi:MAG: oligosaccharide flippase family protein [Candidatus Desantisbacteria bacterium]
MLFNMAYFILNLGIGIWLVPYLIVHLGVTVYGIVPLAISITAYIGLITISLNSSVSRFLTIELQKKDTETANRTFNTAFWGSLSIGLCLFPFMVLVSFFVPNILNIPDGYENETRIFFFFMMTTFLVSVVSANFSVSSFAQNRLDLSIIVQGIGLISRILLIIVLFALFSPQLWYVGISFMGGALFTLVGAVWLWKKLTPELNLKFSSFDYSRLKDLLGMGGWVLINQVGTLLFLNIDLIVVNKLFGAESGGCYASVLQWVILLRSLSGILAGLLTPTILACYANGKTDQIIMLSKISIKFLGLAMALPIGLICGFSAPLLSIWLGPNFSKLAPLMWLLVGHLCINIAVLPMFSIQQALNKVSVPGVLTFVMGCINLFLAIFLPLAFGWGIYGVASAGAIVLTLKNAIFTPWYSSRILNKPWHAFVVPILPGMFATIGLIVGSFMLLRIINITNWFELIACFSIISLVYLVLVYYFVLKTEDRELIVSFLPRKTT